MLELVQKKTKLEDLKLKLFGPASVTRTTYVSSRALRMVFRTYWSRKGQQQRRHYLQILGAVRLLSLLWLPTGSTPTAVIIDITDYASPACHKSSCRKPYGYIPRSTPGAVCPPGVRPGLLLRGKRYGRVFNNIMQAALLLRMADENGAVALVDWADSTLSGRGYDWQPHFFDEWFDLDEIVGLNKFHEGNVQYCPLTIVPPDVIFWGEGGGPDKAWSQHPRSLEPYITQLRPKKIIRQQATSVISDLHLPRPSTAVHARRFEGACSKLLRKGTVLCTNRTIMALKPGDKARGGWGVACNWTSDLVEAQGAVLFSDGQYFIECGANAGKIMRRGGKCAGVGDDDYSKRNTGWRRLDVSQSGNPIPYRSKITFPVSVWMQVLTDRYFGNPASSIGFVVSIWRRAEGRGSWPPECYAEHVGGETSP